MRRVLLAFAGLALLASFLVAGAERSVAGTAPPPDGVHVAVEDFYFDPATVPVRRGGTVVFDFVGDEHHTATDSSGLELYDSGPVAPDASSTWFTFEAAGIFSFVCTPHEGMGGRVSVPVRAAPASGGLHARFTVTWASADATGNHMYDVQIRRPGATWTSWRKAHHGANRRLHPMGRAGPLPVPGTIARRRTRSSFALVGDELDPRWLKLARRPLPRSCTPAVASIERPGTGHPHDGEKPWSVSRWAHSSIRS